MRKNEAYQIVFCFGFVYADVYIVRLYGYSSEAWYKGKREIQEKNNAEKKTHQLKFEQARGRECVKEREGMEREGVER